MVAKPNSMAASAQLDYSTKAQRLLAIVRHEAELAGIRSPHIILDRGNITMGRGDHEVFVGKAGRGSLGIRIKSDWFDAIDDKTERQIREALQAGLRTLSAR